MTTPAETDLTPGQRKALDTARALHRRLGRPVKPFELARELGVIVQTIHHYIRLLGARGLWDVPMDNTPGQIVQTDGLTAGQRQVLEAARRMSGPDRLPVFTLDIAYELRLTLPHVNRCIRQLKAAGIWGDIPIQKRSPGFPQLSPEEIAERAAIEQRASRKTGITTIESTSQSSSPDTCSVGRPGKLTPAQMVEAHRLHAEGFAQNVIARHLDVAQGTISKVLQCTAVAVASRPLGCPGDSPQPHGQAEVQDAAIRLRADVARYLDEWRRLMRRWRRQMGQRQMTNTGRTQPCV